MGRLNLLAENQLSAILGRLRQDVDALRVQQPTSGRSGVLSYLAQTANQWDSQGTVNSGKTFTITYTSDGTQPYPFAVPFADLFVVQVDEAHRLSAQQFVLSIGGGDNAFLGLFAGDIESFLALDDAYALDDETYKWTVELSTEASVAYYFKAYVKASARGTVSVAVTGS